MGAWNRGPFDNDRARDWLWNLKESRGDVVLRSALEAVVKSEEPPNTSACEQAIASAAVVLTARQEPVGRLPDTAKAWVVEHGFVPSDAVLEEAIKAVEKIAARSELRDLWEETTMFSSWLKATQSMLEQLREARSQPPPKRSPKPPGVPRRLDKLIEAVSPFESGPIRKLLWKKIEALRDVNAPLPKTLKEPPLCLVAKQGLLPEAELLLKKGAKVNLGSGIGGLGEMTPLFYAANSGQVEMVELLLQQGARFEGDLMLVAAFRSGSLTTLKSLLHHGARLDEQTTMRSGRLLHLAAEHGSAKIVEFLAQEGLDVNAASAAGQTPLHRAALRGNHDAAQKLLELGANPNVKDDLGRTPLDWVGDDESEVAILLRQFGGRLKEAF